MATIPRAPCQLFALLSLRIVEFRNATLTVSVGGLEARALLPALPVRIQEFKTLVERGGINRELGERDCGCQRDVREGGLVTTEQPIAAVRQVRVDQCRVGQCFLAGVLTPRLVL